MDHQLVMFVTAVLTAFAAKIVGIVFDDGRALYEEEQSPAKRWKAKFLTRPRRPGPNRQHA